MPASERITLHLNLDLASEPIEGEVRTEDGRCLPFNGWLGLTAALEHASRSGTVEPTTSREAPHVP